ncbi:hypothetical protein V6N13_072092 [Hibiscus sabdariffa]|uniref:Uncharacterized protein n=1 Tax=Hibiscus sabdariffa TaxID=183260 RepID=A0ABR2TBI1_9ROSI
MEGMGVYVNFNTGLEILNPGLKGQKILSYPTTRSQNAPSSNQETTSTTAPKRKYHAKSQEKQAESQEKQTRKGKMPQEQHQSHQLFTVMSYLLDLGRKRSIDIVDDVPNTQESNTGTKKQKKGKKYDQL